MENPSIPTNEIVGKLLGRYPELSACVQELLQTAQQLIRTFRSGGKLLLCGNGGSAADCDHIVGELMKGFMLRRPLTAEDREKLAGLGDSDSEYLYNHLQGALPAISLSAHSALISAYSNDVAADMVFAQQVFGYGREGDALLAISTSGNSENIIRAVQVAKACGLHTIGLTGRSGGRLGGCCDIIIRVPYDATPDIQERHLPIYHALCLLLEEEFFA